MNHAVFTSLAVARHGGAVARASRPGGAGALIAARSPQGLEGVLRRGEPREAILAHEIERQPPAPQPPVDPLTWLLSLPAAAQRGWVPGVAWPGAPVPGAPPPAATPGATPPAQPPPAGPPPGLAMPSAQGAAVGDAINRYRQSRGLAAVPRSHALGAVAEAHVRDLEAAHSMGDRTCNMHSWSKGGRWTPCCYTADHAQAACMWRKPAEIAGFVGTGYEIAFGTTGQTTPDGAVEGWKQSSGHHSVMANLDTWRDKVWRSMGTASSTHFSVAWFAEEADPAGGY